MDQSNLDMQATNVDKDKTDASVLDRTEMLTVQKLIDYLKTQDPNACILAYEGNSFAYIEQLPDLPNRHICTVAEHKVAAKKWLEQWHRDEVDSAKKVKETMDEEYRYAKDNDVIIEF